MSKFFHRIEDALLIAALGSMLSMALLQILLRNFFDVGLLWIDPFLRILVLWVAMLGAMVATRERNHISIDVLARYAPPGVERTFSVITSLAAAGICGAVAWTSIEFIRYEYEDGTIAFASVPTWVCQAIMPVGFTIMGLRFLINAGLRAVGRGE